MVIEARKQRGPIGGCPGAPTVLKGRAANLRLALENKKERKERNGTGPQRAEGVQGHHAYGGLQPQS